MKILYNDGGGDATHGLDEGKRYTARELTSIGIDASDILGTVLIQGDDGRFYELALDVTIEVVDPADLDLEVRKCSFCQKLVVETIGEIDKLYNHLYEHTSTDEMEDDEILEFFPLVTP